PSILRLASSPDGTGLPLSSFSDQVWSSGKFFCKGGSGFGVLSSSSCGPDGGPAKAGTVRFRAAAARAAANRDFSMRFDPLGIGDLGLLDLALYRAALGRAI